MTSKLLFYAMDYEKYSGRLFEEDYSTAVFLGLRDHQREFNATQDISKRLDILDKSIKKIARFLYVGISNNRYFVYAGFNSHTGPDGKEQIVHHPFYININDSFEYIINSVDDWKETLFDHYSPPKEYKPHLPEKKTPGFIYLAHSDTNHYKIGFSKEPEKRVKYINKAIPIEINMVHFFEVDDMVSAEKALHEKFKDKRYKGEWFELDNNDISHIKSITSYSEGVFNRD